MENQTNKTKKQIKKQKATPVQEESEVSEGELSTSSISLLVGALEEQELLASDSDEFDKTLTIESEFTGEKASTHTGDAEGNLVEGVDKAAGVSAAEATSKTPQDKGIATVRETVEPAGSTAVPAASITAPKGIRKEKIWLRNAKRKVDKLEGRANLSKWEKATLERAKAILASESLTRQAHKGNAAAKGGADADKASSTSYAAKLKEGVSVSGRGSSLSSKRGRSDDVVEPNDAKKVKASTSSEMRRKQSDPKDELLVAVINELEPCGRLTIDQWKNVEEKFQDALWKELSAAGNGDLQFDGAGWEGGRKVVACGNKLSVEFLRRFVLEVCDTWEGMRVMCVTVAELAKYTLPTAWVWVPCPYTHPEKLLGLLHVQNRELKADTWRVLKTGPRRQYGQHFLLSLNRECLPYLEESKGMVRYSMGRLMVKPSTKGSNEEEPPQNDGSAADKSAPQ